MENLKTNKEVRASFPKVMLEMISKGLNKNSLSKKGESSISKQGKHYNTCSMKVLQENPVV